MVEKRAFWAVGDSNCWHYEILSTAVMVGLLKEGNVYINHEGPVIVKNLSEDE